MIGTIRPRLARCARFLIVGSLAVMLLPRVMGAQEAADFFRQNCANCHTIGGGRLTGPDLKDVTQRRDPAWLTRFLGNPKTMIDSGDAYAARLMQEARGVVMPSIPGMTPERAKALLDLITAESKLAKSQFAGFEISDKPFTVADVERGRALYVGVTRLQNGGAACLSCHTVRGVGALGGGRLGPDLTRVYERLQGRKPMAAWLVAPPSPTMQSVFRKKPLQPEEIFPLVGFFEDAAKRGGEDDSVSLLNFFLLGLGGAAAGLVIFDAVWKRRFRGVRRPLVRHELRAGR